MNGSEPYIECLRLRVHFHTTNLLAVDYVA